MVYETGSMSTAISDACKISKISEGKWYYAFEDRGWFFPHSFDYDEPIVEVEEIIENGEEKAKFTIREWEGKIPGSLFWSDKLVFAITLQELLGGVVGQNITIPKKETTDPFISEVPEEEKSWWDKLIKDFWEPQPWYVKAGIVLGTIGGMTFGAISLGKTLIKK